MHYKDFAVPFHESFGLDATGAGIGEPLYEQRPFDEPVASKSGNERGASIDQGRLARRRHGSPRGEAIDEQEQRHDYCDDGNLPDFNPYIEEGKGDQQRILGQPEVTQHAGESEAVNQAEEECDPPTSFDPPVEEIFYGDGDDARGDQWLDQASRQVDQIER